MDYIIVTGASSGIGEALSYELAHRGHNLIVVARNRYSLDTLKKKLESTYGIQVIPMNFDLSQLEQIPKLHEACRPYEVIGLINNAGYGLYGAFIELDLGAERNLIDLNITSLHMLSKLFLKDFIKRERGYLLNVSSTAAFQAGPYMASYYASKAYVLNLTEAIAEELKHSYPNIIVSVLCPGPVATNFQKRAKIILKNRRLPTAEEVAHYGVKHWFRGKVLIIPKFSNRLLIFGNRLLPRSYGRYLVKKNQLKKK